MKISTKAVALIKAFESFRELAYKDTGGVWTIGYGTTRYPNKVKVKEGDTITEDEALKCLAFDISRFEADVNRLITKPLNQNQFDALVCLVYNIGPGEKGFEGSTVRKLINNDPDDLLISDKWIVWRKDNGNLVRGLLLRRLKEATLYFS